MCKQQVQGPYLTKLDLVNCDCSNCSAADSSVAHMHAKTQPQHASQQ